MSDTASLREAVEQFKFNSRPSSSNGSESATVKDIKTLIKNTAKVLYQIIDEIDALESR